MRKQTTRSGVASPFNVLNKNKRGGGKGRGGRKECCHANLYVGQRKGGGEGKRKENKYTVFKHIYKLYLRLRGKEEKGTKGLYFLKLVRMRGRGKEEKKGERVDRRRFFRRGKGMWCGAVVLCDRSKRKEREGGGGVRPSARY